MRPTWSRYAELILLKSYADLRAETERTLFGFAWWFIDPIFNMAVFYFVFGFILQRGTPHFVPFLLTGLVVWKWFGSAFSSGGNAISSNVGLIRQVRVPKIVFPLISVVTDSFRFSIAFAILLVFLWIYGFEPRVQYLALPAVLATELLFILGTTVLLCSLTPFLPDINMLLENVLRAAFFLSGIFFPISNVPPEVRGYFYLNPMVTIIESFRDVLMYGRWPDWSGLGIIAFVSLLLGFVGLTILRRNDGVYEKYLT